MPHSTSIPRREFVAAASLSAFAARRVRGANDRIGIGLIGCGNRGINALLKGSLEFREQTNFDVRAVCDIWRQHREEAAEFARTRQGEAPRQIVDYREVLSMGDIDAVIIATPDHQHAPMLTDAVRAGKDAYVEKPLAMDMKELLTAVDTVKRSDRVVQMGTQVRATPQAMAARKFVSEGGLGPVFKVEQSRNAYKPYWHRYGERSLAESDTDWRAFVMHRKARPFDADQHTAWYGYRDFSRGPHANLMVHFIDLVHHITGAEVPSRVVTLGGTYRWKDARTAPDSVETILEYQKESMLVRYSSAFGTSSGNYMHLYGTKGMLNATQWGRPWPISGAGSQEPDRIAEGATLPEVESKPLMLDWLECLRTRRTPIAPIDAGYSHSVAVIMSDEALIRGKRMVYDATRRAIREG